MTQTWPDTQASLGLEIHDAKTFFDMLIGVSDVTWLPPLVAPLDEGNIQGESPKSPEIVTKPDRNLIETILKPFWTIIHQLTIMTLSQ